MYSTAGVIRHPQDIEHLLLYTEDGGIVPLSSVATVEETVNTESIRRVDGARTVTLSIIPPREIPLEVGVETVKTELIDALRRSGDVDDSVQMHISGASDLLNATREALGSNFIIAVVVSYLLLVAIFSHWGYPFLILTSVPIGISGGIVRAMAAQFRWRQARAIWYGQPASTVRYDYYAGIPGAHRYRGQQPDFTRRAGPQTAKGRRG